MNIHILVLASIVTITCSSTDNLDLGTIIFANILYRHGDKTPDFTYPNDPYNETSWSVPYGQLTDLGKHQLLLHGRWLRKRYSHLLSDIYTPYDIYVQSTDVDRTLMSAEVTLAGLYPPVENQVSGTITWMPIPVHTVPIEQDYILRSSKRCPRYDYELEKVRMSPEIKRINEDNAKLYAYLTEHSGMDIFSFLDVTTLYIILNIENLHNKTLPEWTKSVFPEKMLPLAFLGFKTEACNKILQRLKSGPLLGQMIDHMIKKAQHALKPDRKVWMYIAHDLTVINMLTTLNLFELHIPPYAATILIELRTNSENQYFVTISYKNSTEEPMLMTLPGCTALCPLNKFIDLTKDVIPQDWDRECLIGSDTSSGNVIVFLPSSILNLGLLILSIVGYMY